MIARKNGHRVLVASICYEFMTEAFVLNFQVIQGRMSRILKCNREIIKCLFHAMPKCLQPNSCTKVFPILEYRSLFIVRYQVTS
jgi:hypothetical protein